MYESNINYGSGFFHNNSITVYITVTRAFMLTDAFLKKKMIITDMLLVIDCD